MKIALIGASGYVGSKLLAEALQRGHAVTAIVRNPERLPQHDRLLARRADVYDTAQLAEAVRGADVVLSAFASAGEADDVRGRHLRGSQSIVEATRQAGVPRLVAIGGAGSLYVAPGVQAVDTEAFPAEWKQGALGARDALLALQAETALDWSFVSPAPMLQPGEPSGRYQVGGDAFPLQADGSPATLSTGDLAMAVLDEIEQPRHSRRRFSVFQ